VIFFGNQHRSKGKASEDGSVKLILILITKELSSHLFKISFIIQRFHTQIGNLKLLNKNDARGKMQAKNSMYLGAGERRVLQSGFFFTKVNRFGSF